MRWRNLLILVMIISFAFLADNFVLAQEPKTSELSSMSVEAFFKLNVTEQQNVLSSEIVQRLKFFENVKYSTSFILYNITGGSTFPYTGPIPPPSPEQNKVLDVRLSKRLEGSYKTETKRENAKIPDLRILTVNAYDASLGEFRATNTAHEGEKNHKTHAAISTEKDIIDKEDRFSYWGFGKTEPRGVFFLDDSLRALEELRNPSNDGVKSDVLILAGKVGGTKTIALTFRSVIPGQVNIDGKITVEFDPERQFLPIAFHLERHLETGGNRKLHWFEAMLVLDAKQVDGVWCPTRFQLLQANEPLTATNESPLYDVQVKSIEFGSVTPDDIKLTFPAGVRVVDRIREVGFISDGKGGVQDGKIKSIAQLDLSGAAAKADLFGTNAGSLLLLNLGIFLIFCGVFLVRRRIRQNAKKGN